MRFARPPTQEFLGVLRGNPSARAKGVLRVLRGAPSARAGLLSMICALLLLDTKNALTAKALP